MKKKDIVDDLDQNFAFNNTHLFAYSKCTKILRNWIQINR